MGWGPAAVQFILDQLGAVAEALNHPCVFSYLHVPVQSGADPVLKAMNREYSVAEFEMVHPHPSRPLSSFR